MGLRIGALGPLTVERDGARVSVDRPAQRRLLSIFSLNAGRRISTDVLIDRFWPDGPPETARAAIQTHISGLRRVLGDGHIATEGFGYLLKLDEDDLDAHRFEKLAASAKKGARNRDWESALLACDGALELWVDTPYQELSDDEFARPEIAKLTELQLELLELRAEAQIALGRGNEALPELEALVIAHPYRERLWEHLMTARYRLGRHTEALQAFKQVSDHLAEIGVEPGEPLRGLEEKILLHDKSLTQARNNLPTELDTFLGREQEIKDVEDLLADSRLVTLVGPGGSGKTRLATKIGRQLLERFPDGVWFVELADLDDRDLIPPAIADSIGISADGDVMPVLRAAFANRRSLLILDNCEHLIRGAGAVVTDLLTSAEHLHVLTTSRQPLRAQGEYLFQVPGLALPPDGDTSGVMDFDGVRLFHRRAQQADPSFQVENSPDLVVAICRRLDAMPLGIELAAARVSSLGLEEIERHLDRSFGFLTAKDSTAHPRHQTLEAAIEWSYRLADEELREALATLSVFRGGFNLEMAIWMLGEEAPRLVAELVDQSLVTTYQGVVGLRYRILETIRQFGSARAKEAGILDEAFARHAEWAVFFSERIWGRWQEPEFDRFELEIHEEFENLTAAYEWADSTGDDQLAGRVVEGLLWHWQANGHLNRALELYDRALETCHDPDRRVGLLGKRSGVRFNTNDNEGAFQDAETAYRLAESLPPSTATAYATSAYAHIHAVRPDRDASEGLRYAREAVEIAKRSGNDLLVAVLELDVALALGWAGLNDEAEPALERAVAMVERTGDVVTIAYSYTQAATVAMQSADLRREGMAEYSRRLMRLLEAHPHVESRFRMGWIEWAMIQSGEFEEIESMLGEWGKDHLEGFHKLGNLVPLGTALWMQGHLKRAVTVIDECEQTGVNPRWYHDFIPLKVDVLVDLGRLEEAVEAADVYLNFETDPTETAMKLGALHPLVRGMADRAELSDGGPELDARASQIVETMQTILDEFPPPMDGSVAMETPKTHLLFGKAELTRLTGPDPAGWQAAIDAADFTYFRLYAQIRLGEALLATGYNEDGRDQLAQALSESRRIGAARLEGLAEDILSR